MKFVKRIRAHIKATKYRMSANINALGIDLTPASIAHYEKTGSTGMRLDVLCAIRKISGLTWGQIGEAMDVEFLPERRKKNEKVTSDTKPNPSELHTNGTAESVHGSEAKN